MLISFFSLALPLQQSLGTLPEGDRFLSFKIDYYDDIVPHDYEPPMFRAAQNEEEAAFSYEGGNPARLNLVDLETGHYNLRSRIRVNKNNFEIDGEAYQETQEGE